jgi:hypothetical protein
MASATPIAEDLVGRARKGEKLTLEDRRYALQFLMYTEPDLSRMELGRIFQVDESTIRHDIKRIKEKNADLIKEDTDVKLIIADLIAARDRALLEIEKAKKLISTTAKEGTPNHLNFIKASVEIHMKVTEALQNMGWLPKNIGAITVNKHVFKAIVQKGQYIQTLRVEDGKELTAIEQMLEGQRPLDMFDDIRDGESLEDALKRQAQEQKEIIEGSELVDVSLLPENTDNAETTTSTTAISAGTETGEAG